MSFSIGDKVEITSGLLKGNTGVISAYFGDVLDGWGRNRVLLDKGGAYYVSPSNLECIIDEEDSFPRTIEFKDIRKGDKVRATRTFTDGSEITHTGYMDSMHRTYNQVKYWGSEDNRAMIYEEYVGPETVTYELLEREGKKLPTKTGSVIRVKKVSGTVCDTIALLDDDGDWTFAVEVDSIRFPLDEDIQEWEELKVVPV